MKDSLDEARTPDAVTVSVTEARSQLIEAFVRPAPPALLDVQQRRRTWLLTCATSAIS
ncbi:MULTISPECIES: hypothetical protein [Streptomyces]|uniref:Uncharacterized protein n=1 Tax=Streptomyces caniscabiei TaxID=2746961 RepID=A0ABU4MP46_9ACTN|nr:MULTISPECIES: hypothetical protein [Streptomyces]MBE4734203.1 hypothetical protein [Streptomyces caniscabiei]MBE4759189.1 hypothetical protein [Streptomyces caniscabiei]MBE4773254.1 hypothetical protein [Streptomyces caniscabiei]MBE4783641.1 hypothetical protein [Streptomyces caniscabiei]MBE4792945.1 hypothetical protein [Streptomyces caniscabiei]